MLANVIDVLVDNPQNYTKKDKEKVLEMANLLAPAIITKSNSKKEVSKQYMGILAAIGGGAILMASILGNGLTKGKK